MSIINESKRSNRNLLNEGDMIGDTEYIGYRINNKDWYIEGKAVGILLRDKKTGKSMDKPTYFPISQLKIYNKAGTTTDIAFPEWLLKKNVPAGYEVNGQRTKVNFK